jgi:hypothetical protein
LLNKQAYVQATEALGNLKRNYKQKMRPWSLEGSYTPADSSKGIGKTTQRPSLWQSYLRADALTQSQENEALY